MVASLGALLGVWFARRNKPRAEPNAVSARAPIVGLISTFLIRFGWQRLADTWIRLRHPD